MWNRTGHHNLLGQINDHSRFALFPEQAALVVDSIVPARGHNVTVFVVHEWPVPFAVVLGLIVPEVSAVAVEQKGRNDYKRRTERCKGKRSEESSRPRDNCQCLYVNQKSLC